MLYVQKSSVEGMIVKVSAGEECRGCGNGQLMQERNVECIILGSMCRRSVKRVLQGAINE